MPTDSLRDDVAMRFAEQEALLTGQKILQCPPRAGVREEIGALFDERYYRLCAALKPDLAIEVGAHEATYAQKVKALSPSTRVVAFEANPYVVQKYQPLLADAAPAVDYRHAAVSDAPGDVAFHIAVKRADAPIGQANTISSIRKRSNDIFEYEEVRAPATTLDAIIDEFRSERFVVWIDAEGAQAEVIAGGARALEKAAAVYVEVELKPIWGDQLMVDGVRAALALHGLVPLMRDNLAIVQYNEVFIRPEAENLAAARAIVDDYMAALRTICA